MSPSDSAGTLMGTHPGDTATTRSPAPLQGPNQHSMGSEAGKEGILHLLFVCFIFIRICVSVGEVWVEGGSNSPRIGVPLQAGSCRHLPCLLPASSANRTAKTSPLNSWPLQVHVSARQELQGEGKRGWALLVPRVAFSNPSSTSPGHLLTLRAPRKGLKGEGNVLALVWRPGDVSPWPCGVNLSSFLLEPVERNGHLVRAIWPI